MNRVISALKIATLIVLSAFGVAGFVFARLWQQNPRPQDAVARWTAPQARLGAPTVLHLSMKLPWHHRPASSQPFHIPYGWVAQQGADWIEGPLELSGYRQWSLESTLVPVGTSAASGGAIAWPLRTVSGPPPRAAEFTVPSLPLIAPADPEARPRNPSIPLVWQPPRTAPTPSTPPPSEHRWARFITVFIVATFIWLTRRLSKRAAHAEPPWTRALANLARLAEAPLGEAQAYCTRLSDILKEYSTQRFDCNLVGTSSTEFLRELALHHPLADADKQALQATLSHADLVRFAGAELGRDSAAAAVEHARRFVINTTPTTDSDRA